MIRLLLEDEFSEEERSSSNAVFTKHFQHIAAERFLRPYAERGQMAVEIGAAFRFVQIERFAPGRRAVIDPYNGAEGAGPTAIPPNFPADTALHRCLLGVDSETIPSETYEVSFSISVLEHIGQAESHYDCEPTDTPPQAQENLRDAFCAELFRITAPGGVTFHTIDHAARNLSFVKNFKKAGFEPLMPSAPPSVAECLVSGKAIRQRRAWWSPAEVMPPHEQRLNAVLAVAFRKPESRKPESFWTRLGRSLKAR